MRGCFYSGPVILRLRSGLWDCSSEEKSSAVSESAAGLQAPSGKARGGLLLELLVLLASAHWPVSRSANVTTKWM